MAGRRRDAPDLMTFPQQAGERIRREYRLLSERVLPGQVMVELIKMTA